MGRRCAPDLSRIRFVKRLLRCAGGANFAAQRGFRHSPAAESNIDFSLSSLAQQADEGFLARLVVLASGTGAASLRIEFYLGGELIAAEPLIVNPLTVSEFLEGALPLLEGDGAVALAQPPAEEYFGSEEEDYFPDIGPLIPDVL